MAGHDIDQDDLTTQRFDDLAADDLLTSVVAPFDQYRRLYASNQFFRRILFEHGNKIDRFERSEHFSACLHRLNRTTRPFQASDRFVAVQVQQPDDRTQHARPARSLT